jgi:hypothetical protein
VLGTIVQEEDVNDVWERLRPISILIYIGIGFDFALLTLSFFIGNSLQDYCFNIMFVLLGMGLSIPVGLLLSPLTPKEESDFSTIGKALLAFGSGYLLSKLDQTIAAALAPDTLLTVPAGFRVGAFLLCFAVGVSIMYASRQQWAPDTARVAPQK